MENIDSNISEFNAEDYVNLAQAQESNAKYSEAVLSFKKAISLYEEQYLKNVVDLYSHIAHIMERVLSNGIEAESNFLKCIDCCEKLIAYGNESYSYGVASRVWDLAIVQKNLKKFIKSEENYNKAIDVYNQRVDEYQYVRDIYDLATALFQRGELRIVFLKKTKEGIEDLRIACEKYEIVFQYTEDLNLSEIEKAEIFMEYAVSKFELKQYLSSVQYFKKSLEMFVSSNRRNRSVDRDIFCIYNYLCYLCKLGGKANQAFDFAQRAYVLATSGCLHLKVSDFTNTTIEILQENIRGFQFGMELNFDMDCHLDVAALVENVDWGSLLDIDWGSISDATVSGICGLLSIFNTD